MGLPPGHSESVAIHPSGVLVTCIFLVPVLCWACWQPLSQLPALVHGLTRTVRALSLISNTAPVKHQPSTERRCHNLGLPFDLMGEIFTFLGPKCLHRAAVVCWTWNEALCSFPPCFLTLWATHPGLVGNPWAYLTASLNHQTILQRVHRTHFLPCGLLSCTLWFFSSGGLYPSLLVCGKLLVVPSVVHFVLVSLEQTAMRCYFGAKANKWDSVPSYLDSFSPATVAVPPRTMTHQARILGAVTRQWYNQVQLFNAHLEQQG
eukprot:TRINITY_DN66791_c6_g8_i1.p1 TRINITY_DN66791_c6_g8~~TRINITY_DN66791_c6_g8_i1.p1  ORF type:complete len:262 (-),score=3.00 TRINITY_DN66791_c6_g8_i1:39-824(-)